MEVLQAEGAGVPRILVIRGQRVILDHDLAKLYGVRTAALNQAVRRNPKRFPEGFLLIGAIDLNFNKSPIGL